MGQNFGSSNTNLLAEGSWSTNNLSDIDRSREENENQTHTHMYTHTEDYK